jgi:hypothetical protein
VTTLDVLKMRHECERTRLLDKARALASELESAAESIAKAVEENDLNRLAWCTRAHDVELSTRAAVLQENLQLIASFTAQAGGAS